MASTHKHIRSGTANKRPTTAIADGQIALNTNLSSPGLFFKDSTGAEILKIGPVHVGATAPNVSPAGSAGNSTGEVWLDTSLTPVGVKIWNGSAFVNATPIGSTTVQGLLELATDAETQAGADTARAVTSASLQSKLSDSTSTTSNTTIASSTAVKAAYDLANAALPKAGGTVTGNLEIGTAGSLSFEGATADGFETTIAVVDPTADRTITLPNTTGTVVTTGDTGTVTSTMLLDGTIVDADINASAAIAYSKLASLTSANILVGNSSNVATSTAVTGDVTISNAGVTAISSGAIVNADVNASAAIAGSKISPDFGSQNVVTTGTSTAGSFTPTSTTVPAVGVYSPGANRLGITTNTVERVEFGTSEVVFNDDAADYDFRIEGDTNSNLFFADASAEAVGIRTATPVSELNVSVGNGGNITISNTNDAHSAGLAFGDTTSNSSGRISYDHSTNALAVATNGTQRLTVDTAATTSTLPVVHPLGAVGTPSLTFTGDLNTGIFSPGADQLAISTGGSEKLIVKSDGKVGIGTSSPSNTAGFSQQLQLTGNLPCISIDNTGTGANKYSLGVNASGAFGIWDNTVSGYRMYINSSGLVGIGTTTLIEKLHVNGGIRLDVDNQGLYFNSSTTGITGNGSSSYISFNTSNAEKARLDSSGRLLVGTPTSVGGESVQISNGTTANTLGLYNSTSSIAGAGTTINFRTDGGATGRSQASIAGLQEAAYASGGRLVFSTTADGAPSPTPRMTITNNGRVIIGTTNDPGYQATVVGTNSYAFLVRQDVGNYTYPTATFHSNFTTGDNKLLDLITDAATLRGSITYNRAGGVIAYNTTSDYRAKTVLGAVESPGETIDALKVYRGVMNGATVERPMLVAHEAQEVAPYCVTGKKDAVDDDGNPIYQQMDHQVLVPLLIAEIQQLRARVAALEAA